MKNYVAIWDKTRDTWDKEGFESLRQMWLANVKGLGEEINVTDEKEAKKESSPGLIKTGRCCLAGRTGFEKSEPEMCFILRKMLNR